MHVSHLVQEFCLRKMGNIGREKKMKDPIFFLTVGNSDGGCTVLGFIHCIRFSNLNGYKTQVENLFKGYFPKLNPQKFHFGRLSVWPGSLLVGSFLGASGAGV